MWLATSYPGGLGALGFFFLGLLLLALSSVALLIGVVQIPFCRNLTRIETTLVVSVGAAVASIASHLACLAFWWWDVRDQQGSGGQIWREAKPLFAWQLALVCAEGVLLFFILKRDKALGGRR
jgi:hypothetical protein